MIEKDSKNIQKIDFNWAMFSASRAGHIDVVKFLIEQGAYDFKGAIIEATMGGHLKIIDYLKQLLNK